MRIWMGQKVQEKEAEEAGMVEAHSFFRTVLCFAFAGADLPCLFPHLPKAVLLPAPQ